MHLSYGMQAWYRSVGIEPRCGICAHYEARSDESGDCTEPMKPQGRVVKRGCCYNFERAPGADDE